MKTQQITAAGTGALLFFLFAAGGWAALTRVIPAGLPQSITILGLGFAFLAAYVWLLLSQIRVILSGSPKLWLHVSIAAAEVLAMLVAFGFVYGYLGIMDNTQPGAPIVHHFWTGLYYAVVTFTTLGYGDFYPTGIGRALAAMQALTGYLVLGLLASVAASVISPHSPAGTADEED